MKTYCSGSRSITLAEALLEYRGLAKLKSTYTDKLPRMVDAATGRVHTNYPQAVAVTGRLAIKDPNLQNIPVRTRRGAAYTRGVHASPRHCSFGGLFADRAAHHGAYLAGRRPAERLRRGQDIHRATAAEVFGVTLEKITAEQRRYAKVINFGLIYGM